MDVESAAWVDKEKTTARVTLDEGNKLSVPADVANMDWVEVQKWVDGGGVIADYVAVAETTADFLDKTDKAMNRVAEDAMVLLLQKEVIAKSDMPDAMWTKINARRVKRGLSEV